jgi:uncharacterized protein
MKSAVLDEFTWAVRLDPGEDIHESVVKFCQEKDISSAEVRAIGSVDSPTLAHYRKDHKEFTEQAFNGIYEIVSMLGIVSLEDGKPAAHLHVTISDQGMNALGGHLVKGTCSATVEMIVRRYYAKLSKTFNDQVGLRLWDL